MRDLVHHGEVDINYIVKAATNPSDVLAVSFPAFPPRRYATSKAASSIGYKYLMTISAFNVNALYIKADDTDNDRSFLTCVNRDFKIERSVVELINRIREETGSKRVIAVGSSMGGYCSLYYGLKYGYDVISGAPSYTWGGSSNILYTAGGTSKEDRDFANNLLPDVIRNAGREGYDKSVFISWGKGERLWKSAEHGPKLIADLDAAGIKYTHRLYDYQDHNTLHALFPNILGMRLAVCLGLKEDDAGGG
jgi:pimeloyl-ACP methyl ester carboxylesterase